VGSSYILGNVRQGVETVVVCVDSARPSDYNTGMSNPTTKRRRGEFDDALKGYYQDHDAVLPDENTDYKSLTAESVGSLILGFLSALTFISMLFVIFPIMGIVLGIMAIRKILRATTELEGLGIASAGVALSAFLAIAGTVYQIYMTQYEVPGGYVVVTFSDLIADSRTGHVPEHILQLTLHLDKEGQQRYTPIFVEGYMFPTREMSGIRKFILVPSVERDQFGPVIPNPSQMIDVTLQGELRASYRSSPVRVGGMLIVNPNPAPGTTPYSLKADVFR
jgi:hypothetical protein